MVELAQTVPPPILPMPGPPANLPPFRPNPLAGDVATGLGNFLSNGAECKVPRYMTGEKLTPFFEKCPPAKFLNPANPECSCAEFHNSFQDFAVVMVKSGGTFVSGFGNGQLYPLIFLSMLVVVMVVLCAPFVYYFSYRMSRKEIKDTDQPEFFFRWHKQRLSSLICLVLICFGFALFFMDLVSANTIKFGDILELSTGYPGLVLTAFGFLIWMKILGSETSKIKRPPLKTAKE